MPESNSDLTASLDIICRRGDTFERYITLKTSGVIDNLVGHSFKLQVKEKAKEVLKLEFSMTGGISVTDNVVRLFKSGAQMATIPAGAYRYDFEQTRPDTTVITRLQGDFIVNADVTA